MKLNLLPTTVSKGRQAQSAIFFSALITVAGCVIGFYLASSSSKALDSAKSDQSASVGPATDAYNTSQQADTIMNEPASIQLIKDVNLAKAMIKHNDVYPDLYNSLLPFIPTFYRINSLSATSAGGGAVVTMVGTIDTYQQYADLMLALSRYKVHYVDPVTGEKKDIVPSSISRAGFIDRSTLVPNISETDPIGRPRRLDEAPIPEDPLERLAYFQANSQSVGYSGGGNYGNGTDDTRGAMPTSSLVTVTMEIPWNLTVPEPRQTLMSSGAAAPATGGIGGGPGGPGMPPGMPPGMAGGPGAPGAAAGAGGAPGGTGGKRGGKGAAGSDEGD